MPACASGEGGSRASRRGRNSSQRSPWSSSHCLKEPVMPLQLGEPSIRPSADEQVVPGRLFDGLERRQSARPDDFYALCDGPRHAFDASALGVIKHEYCIRSSHAYILHAGLGRVAGVSPSATKFVSGRDFTPTPVPYPWEGLGRNKNLGYDREASSTMSPTMPTDARRQRGAAQLDHVELRQGAAHIQRRQFPSRFRPRPCCRPDVICARLASAIRGRRNLPPAVPVPKP